MFPQPEGERKGATGRFLVTTSSEPARRGRGKVPALIAQKAQPAAWLASARAERRAAAQAAAEGRRVIGD
jgi:hypothetical protein